MDRRKFLKTAGATALGANVLPFLKWVPAEAAPAGVAVVVHGQTINSLDLHRKGTNRPSYQISVNCYDRLVSFGTKKMPDGSLSYDYSVIQPDLAESWETTADGKAMIFKLRKNAVFADGTPVTAHDVKWSLDRAVSLGGFPTVQMKAGSLEKPAQFVAVDDHTFKIMLIRPSKLTLPDLAVPVPFIINSKLVLKHATKDDPWGTEYLHRHTAGSGAYTVARWDPGQQLVYERNDKWTSGPLPGVKRVILREVPSAATRRALIERSDVDLSFGISDKDAKELAAKKKLKVVSTPIENCIYCLCPNLNFEPFKDRKVRQAVAWSVPYAEIFKVAAYEQGVPMWGGKSMTPADIKWPQPFPYDTDHAKAKALLAETAYKNGFETTLSINLSLSSWMEPAALLIQEGLAKIGIKTTIEKIPGANWRSVLLKKDRPIHIASFGGWLNFPDYFFFWGYHGQNAVFNTMSYKNPKMDALIDAARYDEDPAKYKKDVMDFIQIAMDEAPRIPLYQQILDVGMQKNITGYTYWFHRQLDFRSIGKN